ncbi:MAG: alpha/beta hydrolase [Chloroflexi bacterium]|nr:alpha/beta hydrolase [Chloroflexota bacterium]
MPFCADIFYRQYKGEREGFGVPVILIHGGGSTHMGWPSDLRRLPGQNVFAIDLPGHGLSRQPACNHLDGLVSRLYDYLLCMGFFSVILIGFSLGGALAMQFACKFPERIYKLALISTGSRFLIPDGIMSHLRHPVNNAKVADAFSHAAFHTSTTPSFRRKIIEPLHHLDPFILAADFHMGRVFRASVPETPLKIPFLLIGGADDKVSPPQSIRLLNSFSTKTQIDIITDAGHMVIYEKTRQVRDRLVEFLESKK